jgi:cysteine desulfurase family protein (TIGR01976 family)
MIDVQGIRRQYPALQQPRNGRLPIFFDGPGGTQVPQRVIDAVSHYLATSNANRGGVFATSVETDKIITLAHRAAAELINASSPDEIVFGANMTTLTLHLSRAISRTLHPGDEVVVTRLDHDANITPWTLAARDAGATIRHVDIHPEDCTLDLEDFQRQLSPRTRLVAVAAASNVVGTVNDLSTIVRWAHEAGARVFVDAVHYAPHGPIDVQQWGCDFLACSAYKFFGPHIGMLWGKRDLLEDLPAYKLRPSPNRLPERWMTGTQSHEGLAGFLAAIDYLADIGIENPEYTNRFAGLNGRSLQIHAGLAACQAYESKLANLLLDGLADRRNLKIWGITDRHRLQQRLPTFAITAANISARQLAEHLASREIYTWSGNMYALALTERLGQEERGGFLRIGLIHYNTEDEIRQLLNALDAI